ncbi:RDD family protein [Actinoplanes sp. NPDC049265]|uniref:RDD family protein n=1 Tax=Actinoplanes sp. NPDC049265 TaxID=3363902 RepID=UPI0037179096
MSSLPAGWYKDPADPATQRYWDGEGWVGKAIPADATPPPDGPEPLPEPVVAPPVTTPAPAEDPNKLPDYPQTWTPPPGYPPPPPGWMPPPGWTPPPGSGWIVQARPHGFALAGFGQRLVARLVDVFAVLLLNVVVNGWFAYQFLQEFLPMYRAALADPFGEQPDPSARSEYLLWTMLIVATLLWLLYEAPAIGSRGQTLGKRMVGIKVMAVENTEPLGFGRAFRRWARLGLFTPFWGCAGLGLVIQLVDSLSPLFDQQLRQALHDKTARTVVIALQPDHKPPTEREGTS